MSANPQPATLPCLPCLCQELVASVQALVAERMEQDALVAEGLFHLAMRDLGAPPHALAEDLKALVHARAGAVGRAFSRQMSCHVPCVAADSIPKRLRMAPSPPHGA